MRGITKMINNLLFQENKQKFIEVINLDPRKNVIETTYISKRDCK